MNYNLLSTVYLIDKLEPIATWLTVGLLGACLIALLTCFIIDKVTATFETAKNTNLFKPLAKSMLIGLVFYALVLGITLLIAEICKKYSQAYLDKNWVNVEIITHVFIPTLITLCIALIFGLVLYIVSKTNPEKVKSVTTIGAIVLFVCVVATLITTYLYFANNIDGDGYYTDGYGNLNQVALWVASGVIIVGCVLAGILLGKHDNKPFDTKCITMAGVCVALSFALSYIKLFDMPFGGSVTLASMMPVMLFSYVYGTKKGLICGFVYGMLQAVQDPFVVHPAQLLLDYPVAFAMVGFAGCLTGFKVLEKVPQVKFAISAVIAGSLRFLCHVLSGIFAFGAYALDLGYTNVPLYSLAYNSYMFIDIGLVVLAGVVLLCSKSFRHELEKLNQPLY